MSDPADRWRTVGVVAIIVAALVVAGILFLVIMNWPTVVPDTRTMPLAQATVAIEQASLALGTSSKVATSAVGEGRVVSQRPAGGSSVARRTSVDVTVAVLPTQVPVPDVTGKDATAALATLSAALFQPAMVEVFGTEAQRGKVLDEVPVAGTPWMTGRQVALAVGAGPDNGTGVKVPDLTGKSINAATADLQRLGLGTLGFVGDPLDPNTTVVTDQLPGGGTVVGPTTTVLLLFQTK